MIEPFPTEVVCFIVTESNESVWFYLSALYCLDQLAKMSRISGVTFIELFDERCASSRAIYWRWERSRPLRRAKRRTA